MRQLILWTFAVLGGLVVCAAAQEPPVTTPKTYTRAETLVLVTKDAASQEAVTTDHVRVVEEHDRVWPDDDLGCVARKGLLEPSSIPGYAFVLDVDGRRFEYHADRAGRFKRCPPAKPRTRPIG
ncbi:MAG: hypothetical protein OEW19_07325 [Acidobacteriota bacterium]|nr:hypothetical protein [Acidobacteriota bacterium]